MHKHLIWIVLLLLVRSVSAVTVGMTVLPTGATDKLVYNARFAMGLTVDGGISWQTTANLNQSVLIKGSLDPATAHVGGKADIFIVSFSGGTYTMKTVDGTWVAWNGKVADLQPAQEAVTLTTSQEVTIFQGGLSASGQYKFYIGYLPATSSALIYTATAATYDVSAAATDPVAYFKAEIFDNIFMAKCTLCHVAGGVAGSSDLNLIKDSNLLQQNYDIFAAFYAQQSGAYNYVLSKVSGGNNHGGGQQLPLGGTDYQKMAAFLDLLDGNRSAPQVSALTLFDGVKDQAPVDTLRDASLLLAGRLPTSAELVAVSTGGDTSLRTALLTLMQGTHFHTFLKDAANDRLFIRGNEDFNLADDCVTCFPLMNAEYWRLKDKADASGLAADRTALNVWMQQMTYSFIEAPLELIAYVVENNKPYSEILTADYDMLTPALNAVVSGTAVYANGASAVASFQPGRVQSYYLRDSATVLQQVPGASFPRITNPGNTKVSYPHVGVLNSRAFLSRYPSTATNRNRARARWTYYNFLGVDVESLAKRSTDPVALADTNNPTMNNPSCTVCHSVLDPVAGTFQDYGDNGTYRVALNGTDSLDRAYKTAQGGGLYKVGDTWYKDMRTPGFEGKAAATSNTTRWLAEQIVNDARFATSAVRFWWPAVMGAELLKAPEVVTDADYQARLASYEAQQVEIVALTTKFSASGLSLKNLLADMVLSRWYRADSLTTTNVSAALSDARSLASLTSEKLLSPELLARKTGALTGFNWNAQIDSITATPLSGLENDYNTFYGGIDSFALKVRAREVTPLMSNVVATHALEASCPIVLGDFIRPDAQRLLFGGLSPWLTPLTEASATQTILSTSTTDFRAFTTTMSLLPGAKKVVMSVLNDDCDYATTASLCKSTKNLVIASISITRPNGQTTLMSGNTGTFGSCAAATSGNTLTLYSSCTAEYAFTADISGSYIVTASLAASQSTSNQVLAGLNIEANVTASASTASGASALKNKLVELHSKLLGQTLKVTSPEILASYDLLLQTWQSRKTGGFTPSLFLNARQCDWSTDIGFVSTLSYPGTPYLANGRYNTTAVRAWLGPQAQDPFYMKQSWVVVMAYLLSHYDYLHE